MFTERSLVMTKEGDIVLIYYQDKPTLYARVEAIEFDIKKDWYRVTLLLLSIPIQTVTWILREEYINGTVFTMGGNPMKIERIVPPEVKKEAPPEEPLPKEGGKKPQKGKILKFKTGKED